MLSALRLRLYIYALAFLMCEAVFAQLDCSEYLLGSDTHEGSPHVQAYLKLIDYLVLNNSYEQDNSHVLQRVLQSADVTNAFDYGDPESLMYSNSLMYRLKMAADRLLPELTKKNWLLIQSSVHRRAARWRIEGQDRREKSLATRSVFSPQLLESDIQFARGSGIARSPAWQKIGDRELLAVSAVRGGIAIYRRIGKQISLVVESGAGRLDPISNVNWHTEGGRVFLSVGGYSGRGVSRENGLYWIELVGDRLIYQRMIPVEGSVDHPPVCRTIDTVTYCAVATYFDNIYLFRLVNGRLKKADLIYKVASSRFPLQWFELDGRHYLFSRSPNSSAAFQIVNGKLVEIKFSELAKARPWSEFVQIEIDEQIFFVYTNEQNVRVLEFRENDFHLIDEIQGLSAPTHVSWSLLQRGDRFYLAASSFTHVHFFEFANKKIRKLGSTPEIDGATVAWVPIEERNILAVGSRQGTICYFELYRDRVIQVYGSDFRAGVTSVDTWLRDGNELYQIVGTADAKIHVLSVLTGEESK